MKVSLLLAVCLLLTGCGGLSQLPTAHQIEHMVLFETLGVDGGTEEGVTVTAVSPGRVSAGDNAGQEGVVLTAQAQTQAAAQAQMQTQGSDFLFFGQVEQLVVGSTLGEGGLADFLGYVTTDPQLRLESSLWMVKGSAQGALSRVPDVTNRLTALADDGARLGQCVSRSAREIRMDLAENGATLIPALALGEGDSLDSAGYALIRQGKLEGWVSGDVAQGFTLLLGGGAGATVEVVDPSGLPTALTLEQVSVQVSLEGNRLYLDCQVQAQLAQGQGGQANLEQLGWILEDTLADWLTSAVERCQETNCDYAHLIGKSLTSRVVELEQLRVEVAVQGTVVAR